MAQPGHPPRGSSPTSRPTGTLPVLVPGTMVLLRPGNRIQLGTDPEHALVIELDPEVSARRVAGLLDSLTQPRHRREVSAELASVGLTWPELDLLLAQLVVLGRARTTGRADRTDAARLRRIRVHGPGPLAHQVSGSLADAGFVVTRSAQRPAQHSVGRSADLVILTDYLVHDPMVVTGLHASGTPHLQVRMRDGVGVLGPLVLPGLTSCLGCVDLHRADTDPAWPVVAAQLVRVSGHGSAAAVRATAALVHENVEQLATAIRTADSAAAPLLVDHTVELHTSTLRIVVKRWSPHPLCRCRSQPIAS